MHYPLATTTFTDKQADEIEKPFINALLPRLGVNRKFSRIIVFGPKEMGGFGITKIGYDQIIKHICLMVKHITEGDRLGKHYEKHLATYQITVGCERNFLHSDPNKYFYKPDPTTNSVSYLWNKVWEHNITINIPALENLCPKNDADRAIMDLVLEKKRRS